MTIERAWVSDGDVWGMLQGLAASNGSAASPLPPRLARADTSVRDLADALHLLCALHGGYPGLIDQALRSQVDGEASAWLEDAARGFATERALLARLASAAGPMPSTPGQAETEAAIAGQRHTLDMLAGSARRGVAEGAALALLLDWVSVRAVLGAAARRLGVSVHLPDLPSDGDTGTFTATFCATAALRRAMQFGAEQLLLQQRGLWDLIEARASARGD